MHKKGITQTVLLVSAILMVEVALADIYRWTDENGQVHFSDRPSRSHASEEVKVHINTYKSVTYESLDVEAGPNVVMYSTSWCGVCKKARQYFERNKISYTEHDVERSEKAKAEFENMGAKGVPVILVGNKRMNGFSVEGFEKLYPQ